MAERVHEKDASQGLAQNRVSEQGSYFYDLSIYLFVIY